MYFVRYGEVCARFTGKVIRDEVNLPEGTNIYNVDDERFFPTKELKYVSQRMAPDSDDWDEDLHAAIEAELLRRKSGFDTCRCDTWEDVMKRLEDDEEEDDGRRPLIFPDELSLPTRKLIREVARLEHEEIDFRKKIVNKKAEEIDEATKKEFMELDSRGQGVREALLDSDLGDMILEKYDPVEDMKTMAAQMFFLYSQTRLKAEVKGGKSDEDLFYAGSNLYAHAVVDQLEEEEDEYDDDDDAEDFNPLTDYSAEKSLDEFWNAFGEYMAGNGANNDFMQDMDASTEAFLKGKGFDITTLAGAKAAQKFLENAGPEDAFITEGPVDNEMDEVMGRMRLKAMLGCVKARIQKMIDGVTGD